MIGVGRIKDESHLGYTASTPIMAAYFHWEQLTSHFRIEDGDYILILPPVDHPVRGMTYRYFHLKYQAYFTVESHDLFEKFGYDCYWMDLLD